MEKYVVCKKIEDNSYTPVGSNDELLITLFIFLTDAMDLNRILNKLTSLNEEGTTTNICIVRKHNGNIEVSLDPNVFGKELMISLTIENFSTIISQWQKLYHEGWQKIIITQDDSGVHLEGRNI